MSTERFGTAQKVEYKRGRGRRRPEYNIQHEPTRRQESGTQGRKGNFIANHRAQQFGFHGPDLALQKRNQINQSAQSILPETIQQTGTDSGFSFSVKSQSTLDDVGSQFVTPLPGTPCTSSQPASSFSQQDGALLTCIIKKLHVIQQAKSSLTAPLADSLRDLDTTLTAVSTGAEILPRRVKVAPNRGTWNDTAEVMGVKKKGAKKRKHLDAYAGGQASGKSARNDARTAKKARVADPAMEMPEETLSDEAPLGFEEGFFSDLATPDGGLDQWPVGEPVASEPPEAAQKSPETLLRETFAIYNAMFPPNVPQQTSYYRNNSYPVVTPGSYYRTR
ncbi:hypothetical protein R3P38DRAFT_3362726 [Favolaschia claudopus]|uniref:Uncharacterized protein n=1 Tax=Favolaschia claudopus TaxID=2862362 RepID=A0AAW0AL72_9AGAR